MRPEDFPRRNEYSTSRSGEKEEKEQDEIEKGRS
jgi:hypothetical protein